MKGDLEMLRKINSPGNNLIDIFDQIYVINLPHRTDRLKEIAVEFANIGVDIDNPKITIFPAIRPDSKGEFSSVGARGCYLSHLGVLTDAQKNKRHRILILEDDLNFSAKFNSLFDSVQASLNNDRWSIFYGGHAVKSAYEAEVGPVTNINPAASIMFAHFIAFQGGAIKDVSEYLETLLSRKSGDIRGGPMHVDGAYSWYRKLHPEALTLISNQQLGYQRSSKTDIHDLKLRDKIPIVKIIFSAMRKLKNKFNGK